MAREMKRHNAIRVVDKLRQRSVQRYMSTINWEGSSDFPLIVEFDPTTKCNLACPDCISGSLLNQKSIETDRIETLVHEMIEMGVKGVILIGGGEPMMHPKAGWIIETLGRNGVAVGITTNGLYLRKHMDVTAAYTDWVRVSVDAATPETFQRIRPSRAGTSLFGEVIDAMTEFAQRKKGKLGYSFMIYSEGSYGFEVAPEISEAGRAKLDPLKSAIKTNVDEIYDAAKLAKSIGCDYFEVKPMYDVNHFSVMQKASIAERAEAQLLQCKSLEDGGFMIIEALKLRASLRGESNLEPKPYTKCRVAQMRTLVTPSGVYVCPYFRGVQHKKIGDVTHASLQEVWHGEERRRVMDKLDPSVDCPMHCIRNDSNLYIESLIENGPDAVIDDYDVFI